MTVAEKIDKVDLEGIDLVPVLADDNPNPEDDLQYRGSYKVEGDKHEYHVYENSKGEMFRTRDREGTHDWSSGMLNRGHRQ